MNNKVKNVLQDWEARINCGHVKVVSRKGQVVNKTKDVVSQSNH
jgi:hypothetical protein